MISLSAAVLFHARITPAQTALVYRDQRVSYRELADRTCSCAGMLRERGIRAGDIVALLMKNSSAFIELSLAISHLGAVVLPINFRLASDEVRYILDHAGAKLLCVDSEFKDLVADFASHCVVGENAQSDTRHLAGQSVPVASAHANSPDALYRLMYTSGTTDRPKGVMHTYGNYYWKCLDHIITLNLGRDSRLLVVGPMYHVGAFDLPGMAVLMTGGLLYVLREFEPGAVLGAIESDRLNGGWMAPVMLSRVLSFEGREKFDLSSFKWLIGGGERTPEERIRGFTELFREGRYIDAFGLTETCSGDTFMEPGMEITKIGSTGRPTPHVAIEIRDPKGVCLASGEPGEICIRGPKVTPGYWRAPEKTEASFFAEGWFRTGDIGYLDADGFLFITDRMKDMIISGGENIASSEVERVLYQLEQVSEAAVIGLPDKVWGERVVAFIVLQKGSGLAEAEVLAHCRKVLAGFKVPKQIFLTDTLPRNPSGKVLKRVLRSQCMAQENT